MRSCCRRASSFRGHMCYKKRCSKGHVPMPWPSRHPSNRERAQDEGGPRGCVGFACCWWGLGSSHCQSFRLGEQGRRFGCAGFSQGKPLELLTGGDLCSQQRAGACFRGGGPTSSRGPVGSSLRNPHTPPESKCPWVGCRAVFCSVKFSRNRGAALQWRAGIRAPASPPGVLVEITEIAQECRY